MMLSYIGGSRYRRNFSVFSLRKSHARRKGPCIRGCKCVREREREHRTGEPWEMRCEGRAEGCLVCFSLRCCRCHGEPRVGRGLWSGWSP